MKPKIKSMICSFCKREALSGCQHPKTKEIFCTNCIEKYGNGYPTILRILKAIKT